MTHHKTYGDLLENSKQIAAVLKQKGVSRGEMVVLFLDNSVEYVIGYFAIVELGAIVAPVTPRLTPREIETTVLGLRPTAVITTERYSTRLSAAGVPRERMLMLDDGDWLRPPAVPDKAFAAEDPGDTPVRGPMPALVLSTSGTGGEPKRVLHSHEALLTNLAAHIDSVGLTADDVCLVALPMQFGYCNTAQLLAHLYLGGRLVLMPPGFISASFCKVVNEYQVSCTTLVPTMIYSLVEFLKRESILMPSLRLVCFGGGPIRSELLHQVMELLPETAFIQTYGQTEAGPRITSMRPDAVRAKPNSVGLPIPGVTLRIQRPDGSESKTLESGEIFVRTPSRMMRYEGDPEATRRKMVGEWLRTGDLGYIDEAGFLYVSGRMDTAIITGGFKVHPEEVESCIAGIGVVQEVLVYGVPNARLGQHVACDVVLKPGAKLSADDVLRHLHLCLSREKIPREVHMVEALAKTFNEKIRRAPTDLVVRLQSSLQGNLDLTPTNNCNRRSGE